MADPVASGPTWLQLLAGSGVIGVVSAGVLRAWRWFVERPLRKAEHRAEAAERAASDYRARYVQVAAELKATATALRSVRRVDEAEHGQPLSMPPSREELPTLTHIIESRADRAWAEQRERARSVQLNAPEPEFIPLDALAPADRRRNATDRELRKFLADGDSTPPGGWDPPEAGMRAGKLFPPPRPERKRR